MDRDATWYGSRSRPKRLCVRWDPPPPPQNGGRAPLQFSAHVYCDQTAGWIKVALGTEMGLNPGHIVLVGSQLPLLKLKGMACPQLSAH